MSDGCCRELGVGRQSRVSGKQLVSQLDVFVDDAAGRTRWIIKGEGGIVSEKLSRKQ